MIELRRVRFESIEGLMREDIGTAGEIWLADICAAAWATREAMKLGAYLVRYMIAPDPAKLALGAIEAEIQLGRDEVIFALRLLKLYRAIEGYSVEDGELRVALHLRATQQLTVLETRYRLTRLRRMMADHLVVGEERWVPSQAEEADERREPAKAPRAGRRLLWGS